MLNFKICQGCLPCIWMGLGLVQPLFDWWQETDHSGHCRPPERVASQLDGNKDVLILGASPSISKQNMSSP